MVKISAAAVLRNKIISSGLIPYGGHLLVGVSGGADSITLLHVLYSLRHELSLDLALVHYDHALRAGSQKDRVWVGRMAQALDLRCLWERNRQRCPKGISVEDFARSCRFDFFRRMAQKTGADAVVLAHTQDDLAETVLMRLLRGTGLTGLRAILPRKSMQGVTFLRPMLGITRVEVEAFLKETRVRHIEDPTNAQDEFLRNRVRHQLIPYIARKFAPAIKQKLAELAVNSACDHEVLENEVNKVFNRVVQLEKDAVRVRILPWKRCAAAIRRMILREAVWRVKGWAGQLSHEHVMALEHAALMQEPLSIPLPGGLKVEVTDKFVTLT